MYRWRHGETLGCRGDPFPLTNLCSASSQILPLISYLLAALTRFPGPWFLSGVGRGREPPGAGPRGQLGACGQHPRPPLLAGAGEVSLPTGPSS